MTQQPPQSAMPDAPHSSPAGAVRTVQEVSALIEQSAHDLRSSLNAIQSWAYVLDRAFDSTPRPRSARWTAFAPACSSSWR